MRDSMFGLGPVWGHLLATSAVVVSAQSLGAYWLEFPVMGVPCGLWCIGLGGFLGVIQVMKRTRLEDRGWATRPLDGATRRLLAGIADEAVRLGRPVLDRVGWTLPTTIENGAIRFLEGRPGALRLRVGFRAGDDLARSLGQADGRADIQWIRVSQDDEPRAMRRLRLDALIVQPAHSPLRVVFPESEGREAAWFDWGGERPLSYASVFPHRVDAGQATLGEVDWFDDAEVALLRALVEAGGVLARHPTRLTLTDRLGGRQAIESPETAAGVMATLAERLAGSSGESALARAAARVVGAYFASGSGRVRPETRRLAVECAARVLEGEPEAALRAAAMRLASGEEAEAMLAIRRAEVLLRSRPRETHVDHLAFIQSELATGVPGPLTLGRIAAGLGLLVATTPVERLDYLKDDIAEDLRYSGLLIGRDQDHAMLLDLLRNLCTGRLRAAA